jgi:hypothetical protein
MPLSEQQTRLAAMIDAYVKHVITDGGGDEALLLSMADYRGTFKQVLETCTSADGHDLGTLGWLCPLSEAARDAGQGHRR